jgi:DNA-binding MarR family transcriptional regulator
VRRLQAAKAVETLGAGDVDLLQRSLEQFLRLNASRRVHAKQAAAAGVVISQPGYLLLRRIQEHGPLSLGDLARMTDMDPAAAGRQVRQLEDDGLVTRSASEGDGRVSLVSVTGKGAAARRRIAAVLEAHLCDVLERWSLRDQHQFALLLDRFVQDSRATPYRSG